MQTIKLPAKYLRNLIWEELDDADAERTSIIEDTIAGTSRWSIVHDLVFKHYGKFYKCCYSVGATEAQDEQPFEYQNEVTCVEVRPVEVCVTIYEEVT